MCVVTKVSESEILGYRCACNIGWALSSDLKTCISKYTKISWSTELLPSSEMEI